MNMDEDKNSTDRSRPVRTVFILIQYNVNHLLLRRLYVFFVVKSQRLRLLSLIMAIFAPLNTYVNPLTYEIFLDFIADFIPLDRPDPGSNR
jgi:hypothetical protein